MKTTVATALSLLATVSAWAAEPEDNRKQSTNLSNGPVALSDVEMDKVTAGHLLPVFDIAMIDENRAVALASGDRQFKFAENEPPFPADRRMCHNSEFYLHSR